MTITTKAFASKNGPVLSSKRRGHSSRGRGYSRGWGYGRR